MIPAGAVPVAGSGRAPEDVISPGVTVRIGMAERFYNILLQICLLNVQPPRFSVVLLATASSAGLPVHAICSKSHRIGVSRRPALSGQAPLLP